MPSKIKTISNRAPPASGWFNAAHDREGATDVNRLRIAGGSKKFSYACVNSDTQCCRESSYFEGLSLDWGPSPMTGSFLRSTVRRALESRREPWPPENPGESGRVIRHGPRFTTAV
jgi:hypothetical protein